MRQFLCLITLISILCMQGLVARANASNEGFPVTQAHRYITSQKGWLNTSRPLAAEDLRGRIILLDFWTFCCINCIHIMPDLAYLEEVFGDRLTVIGVHSAKFKNEQDSENIRQAILRYGLHHPVVNDFDFSIWQAFSINAWPTLVLINPRGMIESVYSGEGHRAEIERDIRRLIKQYDGKLNNTQIPKALEQDKEPESLMKFPGKLAYAPDFAGREVLFVSDTGNQRILVMTLDGRIVDQVGSGVAGSNDGGFDVAQFNTPQGLTYHNHMLYIADTGSHALRVADFKIREVVTLAGTGAQGYVREARGVPAREVPLASPWDVALYPDSDHLTIAMAGTHQLWEYDRIAKTLRVAAGNGREFIDDGLYPENSLSQPSGLSVLGQKLYFVDAETSSLRVMERGVIKTLVGTGLFDFGYRDGKAQQALMQHPLGLVATSHGIYIADAYNHSIRVFNPENGELGTLAGHGRRGRKDGTLAEASFNEPNDIIQVKDQLYVADTNNHAIRIIDLKANTVKQLVVRDARTVVDSFSEMLPNKQSREPVTVAAGKPATVRLALQKGWKINHDAPSYLSLFDMNSPTHQVVARFDADALEHRQVFLPALPPDGTYRLQGTLYYCEDQAGAQCLVKSFDIPVTTGKEGVALIALPVN